MARLGQEVRIAGGMADSEAASARSSGRKEPGRACIASGSTSGRGARRRHGRRRPVAGRRAQGHPEAERQGQAGQLGRLRDGSIAA
jgi:hypothetical protein